MDLTCLTTAVLTPEWVVAQQVLKPSLTHQNRQEFLPLTQEPMGQIVPVHQIEESVSKQLVNELQNRIEAIETRIFALEEEKHSSIFLEGEVLFGVTGASGRELDNATVLQASVELLLNASFTGQDILQVGLESGNSRELSFVGETTFEGRLDSPSDTDSARFELSELNYAFPLSDRASLYLSATGDDISEFNPFLEDDAISEFGIENPIHNLIEDVGVQLDYELTDEIASVLGILAAMLASPNREQVYLRKI